MAFKEGRKEKKLGRRGVTKLDYFLRCFGLLGFPPCFLGTGISCNLRSMTESFVFKLAYNSVSR